MVTSEINLIRISDIYSCANVKKRAYRQNHRYVTFLNLTIGLLTPRNILN